MSTTIKGNARVRAFAVAHSAFLDLWTQGMPLVEIGARLGLSSAQQAKHALAAFNAKVSRPEPAYACLTVGKLPESMQLMLGCDDLTALARIEREGDGLIVTLMKSGPSKSSKSVTEAPLLPAVPTDDEACA